MKLFKNHSFRTQLPRSLNLHRSDQSGQAMIEYILVVIISVTMLFLAKGVFSNINNYISGYMGGYFKCLMTQGELPALGVSDGDLSKHTGAGYKCSVSFQKTNLAASFGSGGGKNLGTTTQLSSEPPKGSTKETASNRGAPSSNLSKKPPSAKDRRLNSSSDDDSGTRFSSSFRNRSDAYSSSDSEGDDSVRSVPIPRRDLESEKSENSRKISSELDDALKKKMRGRGDFARRDNTPKKISTNDDDLRPGPRRTKFNPPQRGVATLVSDPDVEMGFGYFMKWIMIAGIGIAIFVFFGGQIMNYNNSDG